MWKWLKKSAEPKEDKQELELLSTRLTTLAGDDFLSVSQKDLMKSELFEAIDWLDESPEKETGLTARVSKLTKGNLLSIQKRRMIYDSVMARANLKRQPWRWAFRSWRAGLASMMILLLALTTFVVSPVDFRVTRASKWTFLENVEGQVFINRNGKTMSANNDFALEEGDLIFTGINSFVTIRYLDDSLTRLGENTSLHIKRLYVRPNNAAQTQVDLALTSGQIWASVYNLIDSESRFTVETDNAFTNVSSRAAFELTTKENSTVVAVFDNVVDVSKKSAAINNIQPIVAGFTAEVKDQPVLIANVLTDVVVQRNPQQTDRWVVSNLNLDKQHQEKLKLENKQFISLAVDSSDDAFSVIANFKDKTQALFANADVEAARQRFLVVQLGVIKAQEFLTKANNTNNYRHQATPFLIQYKTALGEIMAGFDQLYAADAGQADSLLAKMKEEVNLQRKALSLVLPGERLYTVKEVVNDAGYLLARSSADRATYLLDRARNRLLEMQNLIAKNDLKGAEADFRTYLRGLDDLVIEVENSQEVEIEGSLFALIKDQIKQLKQLAAIESEVQSKNYSRLAGLVSAVKDDSARKLVNIIKSYRENGIPFETVLELQNTIDQYIEENDAKNGMINNLEKILANYPEYKQLEEQENNQLVQETKGGDGDLTVIIQDQPATADLEASI